MQPESARESYVSISRTQLFGAAAAVVHNAFLSWVAAGCSIFLRVRYFDEVPSEIMDEALQVFTAFDGVLRVKLKLLKSEAGQKSSF